MGKTLRQEPVSDVISSIAQGKAFIATKAHLSMQGARDALSVFHIDQGIPWSFANL